MQEYILDFLAKSPNSIGIYIRLISLILFVLSIMVPVLIYFIFVMWVHFFILESKLCRKFNIKYDGIVSMLIFLFLAFVMYKLVEYFFAMNPSIVNNMNFICNLFMKIFNMKIFNSI